MAGHGKNYQDAVKLVDRTRNYSPAEAAELVKQTSAVKFDPSVEAHLRLGVDPRHADQMVRGTVVLPHGTGKVVRVAVFAQGDRGQEALRAGADEVGGEDLVKKVEAGWLEFDVALATPDIYGEHAKQQLQDLLKSQTHLRRDLQACEEAWVAASERLDAELAADPD